MQGEKRGREVGGRGRTGQTEAEEESHQLHPGAAERAGAAVRRDALPGRVHEGGAEPAAGPVRGQGAGEGIAPATSGLERPTEIVQIRFNPNACEAFPVLQHQTLRTQHPNSAASQRIKDNILPHGRFSFKLPFFFHFTRQHFRGKNTKIIHASTQPVPHFIY